MRLLIAGIGIAAGIPLAMAIPWDHVWAAISRVSVSLLAASLFLMVSFYALEAVRWSCILGWRVPPRAAFRYSRAAYLTTAIVPLQMGELLKPALLKMQHQIPYSEGLLSVLIGRVLDIATILTLGAVAALAVWANGDGGLSAQAPVPLLPELLAAGLAGMAAAMAGVLLLSRSQTLRPRLRARLPRAAMTTLERVRPAVSSAIAIGQDRGRLISMALLSLVMWVVNFGKVYLLFLALGLPVPAWTVLLGFVIVTLGLTLPIVPGYVGQYEALWMLVFAWLTPIATTQLLAVGLLAHAVILVSVLSLGLPSLWWLSGLLSAITHRDAAHSPPPIAR